MRLTGALNTDVSPLNQPEGSWRYARNMLVSELYSTGTIEHGLAYLYRAVPFGNHNEATIIKSLPLIDGRTILFIAAYYDEIGVLHANGTYEVKVRTRLLNFSKKSPIQAEYEFTWDGDVNVAWTDGGRNEPRILNVDNLPFKTDNLGFITNIDEFNLIKLFTEVKEPQVTSIQEKGQGGSIRTGAHHVQFAYEFPDGSLTAWSDPSNPIYITSEGAVSSFQESDGDPPDILTTKAIKFQVQNIDTRFDKIVLAITSRIGGNVTSKKVSDHSITNTYMEFEYTGAEISTELSTTETLVERKSYQAARTVTKSGNSLMWGNLKGRAPIDFQKYANSIRVRPAFEELNINSVTDSHKFPNKTFLKTSFQPHEVYALYIGLNFTDGTKSSGFHIPGREPENFIADYNYNGGQFGDGSYGSVIVNEDSPYSQSQTQEFERDKQLAGADKIFHTRNSGNTARMGFWKNTNETYEDIFDSKDREVWSSTGFTGNVLSGGIRHHRMPDLRRYFYDKYPTNLALTLYNNGQSSNSGGQYDFARRGSVFTNSRRNPTTPIDQNTLGLPSGDEQVMPIFGIELSNIYIPDELADIVESYEIYYAKRTPNNRLILETGYMQHDDHVNNWGITFNGSNRFTISYPTTDTYVETRITHQTVDVSKAGYTRNPIRYPQYPQYAPDNKRNLSNIYWRIYGFALLNSKPDTIPNYVDIIGHMAGRPTNFITTNDGDDVPIQILGYNFATDGITAPVASNSQIIPLQDQKYVQADSIAPDGYNNVLKDEAFVARQQYIGTGSYGYRTSLDNERKRYSLANVIDYTTSTRNPDLGGQTHVAAQAAAMVYICRFQRDLYNSVTEQTLVSTGKRFNINGSGVYSTDKLFSGDTFIGQYAHHHYRKGTFSNNANGIANANGYASGSIINTVVYSTANPGLRYEGDNEGETYPLKTITLTSDKIFDNFYGYNPDYSERNDLIFISPYSSDANRTDVYPYRAIRSIMSDPESPSSSWRVYPVELYYESVKDRGEIINLQGLDDELFIHHKYGLFKTVSTDRLETNVTEITINTADIFSVKPREMMPDAQGYLGNQHTYGAFLNKGNYVFCDVDAGKVFMVSREGVQEISNLGMRNWFRRNLPFKLKQQLQDEGIKDTFDYDVPTNRLGITIAYDPEYNRIILTKRDFVFKQISNIVYENGEYNVLTASENGANAPFADDDIEDVSWTMSFSFDANQGKGGWIGLHDYFPTLLYSTRNKLISIDGDTIYQHGNSDTFAKFYDDTIYESYVELVHNEGSRTSKIYASINWIDEKSLNDTIDKILVYNNRGGTGVQKLNRGNSRLRRGTVEFNDLRDRVINKNLPLVDSDTGVVNEDNLDYDRSWYHKDKIGGQYVNIRLISSNSQQKPLYLDNVDAKFRLAHL